METSPLDRRHQDKITRLDQEIDTILETLRHQRRVIITSQRYIEATPQGPGPINPFTSREITRDTEARYYSRDHNDPPSLTLDDTDLQGVQKLLTQDSKSLIDRKIHDFRQMTVQASELQSWVYYPLT